MTDHFRTFGVTRTHPNSPKNIRCMLDNPTVEASKLIGVKPSSSSQNHNDYIMSNFSHEEIVTKFLQSKSVDFTALGKFIADNGAQIAVSGSGDYGVRIGHYNILACFYNRISAETKFTGIAAKELASDVLG